MVHRGGVLMDYLDLSYWAILIFPAHRKLYYSQYEIYQDTGDSYDQPECFDYWDRSFYMMSRDHHGVLVF